VNAADVGCLEAMVGEDGLRRRVGERQGREISRDDLIALVLTEDPPTLEVIESAVRSSDWLWPYDHALESRDAHHLW